MSSLKEDYGKGRGWRGRRNLLISILLYFRSLFYLNEDEETREWGQTRFNLDVDIEKGEKRERKKKILI